MGEAAGPSPDIAGNATSASPASSKTPPPAAGGERILLLECRLEQAQSALEEARADADRLRTRLADAAAREADHARRFSTVHQELAEARAEIVSLHERLDRSEALRAELEGHFFEGGAREDAGELLRLRREVLAQRDRCITSERAASRLRTRVDDLLQSREALLSRVAAWQRLIRRDGPEAVDLAEFMAELRRDILDLEHRTAAGERREAALRERLLRAGVDPGVEAREAPSASPAVVVSYRGTEEAEPSRAHVSGRAGDNLYLVRPVPENAAHPEAVEPGDVLSADADDAAAFAAPLQEPAVADDGFAGALVEDVADSAAPDEAVADEALSEADDDVVAAQDDAVAAQDDAVAALDDAVAAPDHAVAAQDGPAAGSDQDVVGDEAAGREPGRAAEAPREREGAAEEPALLPVESVLVDAAPVAGAAVELTAADPDARAAAYGRMVALLDGDRLADHLRAGLADPHPRVRRRTVLAAAAARSVALHPLLDPLRADPDPQVRRVVREVLRHATTAQPWSGTRQESA